MNEFVDTPENRSLELVRIMRRFAKKNDSILEIGSGDGRNLFFLKKAGFKVEGIDKLGGTSIEEVDEKPYDIIYTMSTLFLIPPSSEWVFDKIARMARKYIITFEGESGNNVNMWGRDYSEVFKPFGFNQIHLEKPMFNNYGVLRVLKYERDN